MKKLSFALFVLAFGIMIQSCNDATPIGSELLEEDQVDVLFTDNFNLIASTIKEDSVKTYDPNPSVLFDNFLFGKFSDPIFGRTTAGIYAQLVLDFDPPNYRNAIVDSVVLTLQYDPNSLYGDLESNNFGLSVHRITGEVDKESEYYSNSVLDTDPLPLAELGNFVAKVEDTDSITGLVDYRFNSDGDEIVLGPSIRIPMPISLGEELVNYDSATIYNSNTNFTEEFKGLFISPTRLTPGILSFDISTVSESGLTVYYRQDTVKRQYSYDFSTRFIQYNNFEHNFENTIIDSYFDDTTLGDSLLFIQGMAGPTVKIEIPDLEQFEGVIVNKVELEFTIADVSGDDPNVYLPNQNLIAADLDPNDEFAFASDVLFGVDKFGGVVEVEIDPDAGKVRKFTMNLSSHFQDVIDGRRENVIYLRSFPKQEKAERVAIYGPGHSKFPMKLSMTYTKLN